MARHTTNLTGVIFRDSITNGIADKTYYIRYKDNDNKLVELKIGKYSEGIREAYCNTKRNEYIKILLISLITTSYASSHSIGTKPLPSTLLYGESKRSG